MSRIAIISIPVSNQERSKRFYSEVLGFKVLRDNEMGPGQRWIQLVPPAGGVTITLVSWFENMRPGCVQGIVLETSDVREDYKALRERGLSLSEVQDAPWGTYVTFQDPDGNGWVLQEPSSGA